LGLAWLEIQDQGAGGGVGHDLGGLIRVEVFRDQGVVVTLGQLGQHLEVLRVFDEFFQQKLGFLDSLLELGHVGPPGFGSYGTFRLNYQNQRSIIFSL